MFFRFIGIFILFNPLDALEIFSLLLGIIFVTLGWTFFSIPWWGIGIAISNSNSNDRFKVVSFRELLTIPGVILGLFLISIIVDSRPTDDFPPSSTYFTLFPKSSLTSSELTALTFEERLALGAAKGKLRFFNKFLVKVSKITRSFL